MLHGIEISIAQMTGNRKGVIVTEPVDVIYATRNGKKSKIGFIARIDNAKCVFIRYFPPETRIEIRDAVAKLRSVEFDGYTVAGSIGSIPNPVAIKAYLNGGLHKPAPTTIVRPDGELFEPHTTDED